MAYLIILLQGKMQVHKALQEKSLGELDSSMKPVIQKLMPQVDPASNVPSTEPSINESSTVPDVDEYNFERQNVADAFSVLSRYFQSLSNQFQVLNCYRYYT